MLYNVILVKFRLNKFLVVSYSIRWSSQQGSDHSLSSDHTPATARPKYGGPLTTIVKFDNTWQVLPTLEGQMIIGLLNKHVKYIERYMVDMGRLKKHEIISLLFILLLQPAF